MFGKQMLYRQIDYGRPGSRPEFGRASGYVRKELRGACARSRSPPIFSTRCRTRARSRSRSYGASPGRLPLEDEALERGAGLSRLRVPRQQGSVAVLGGGGVASFRQGPCPPPTSIGSVAPVSRAPGPAGWSRRASS